MIVTFERDGNSLSAKLKEVLFIEIYNKFYLCMKVRRTGNVACMREVIIANKIVARKPRWVETSWKTRFGWRLILQFV
jgi:hypothetical protein